MKNFWRTAGALALMTLMLSSAEAALYQFDDVYGSGNTGAGAQWMVLTRSGTVGGDASALTVDVSGDIVTRANAPVDLWSGKNISELADGANHNIKTMFLVYTNDNPSDSNMTVRFSVPNTVGNTPDVNISLNQPVYESQSYGIPKVPANDTPISDNHVTSSYTFTFTKTGNSNVYESVRGNVIFNQAGSQPDQGLQVPFVLANVRNAAADNDDCPLLFRATLRNPDTDDIIAYDRFTWNVVRNAIEGGSEWVFVPMKNSLPSIGDTVNCDLVTEVTNHSAVRYAVQRQDAYAWQDMRPSHWRFDLPRTTDLGDLNDPFTLNRLSHIVPGLTTVFQWDNEYNVNATEKVPLRLYSVATAAGQVNDFRSLTFDHRVIFGKTLGVVQSSNTVGDNSTSPFGYENARPYRVTGFYFNPISGADFLSDVARRVKAKDDKVNVPDTGSFVTTGTLKEDTSLGDAIVQACTLNVNIPQSLRSTGEGMLPLHVTFNLPYNPRQFLEQRGWWDSMLETWYSTGDVHDVFFPGDGSNTHPTIYLIARDGEDLKTLDLIQALQDRAGSSWKDVYKNQIKIFVDDERKVLTVSFIIMLMDGTVSGRPDLYPGNDTTNTTMTDNQFLVVRDGVQDDKWNLTFAIAPAGRWENSYRTASSDQTGSDTTRNTEKSGGSGGGCALGLGLGALEILAASALTLLSGRKKRTGRK